MRHFKVTGGKDARNLALGDYIDETPKDLMSKGILEEKILQTRSVLLGDGNVVWCQFLLNTAQHNKS